MSKDSRAGSSIRKQAARAFAQAEEIEKRNRGVQVVQGLDGAVPTRVLANAITDIAECARLLLSAGLTENAIVVLIHDHTKVPRTQIREVLRCLPDLGKLYLTKGRR